MAVSEAKERRGNVMGGDERGLIEKEEVFWPLGLFVEIEIG